MFGREFRLRHRKDVDFLMKRGEKLHSKSFVMWFLPSPAGNYRVTVIVGKKCEKSAVKRNLIKRRTREAIRTLLKAKFPEFPNLDMIFWIRHENEADKFDFHETKDEIEITLTRLVKISQKPDFGEIKNRRKN